MPMSDFYYCLEAGRLAQYLIIPVENSSLPPPPTKKKKKNAAHHINLN